MFISNYMCLENEGLSPHALTGIVSKKKCFVSCGFRGKG